MAIFFFEDKGLVETGFLPSGDMTVWHPASASLRGIVEPICRGRGYWNGAYNNWIVKQKFADYVSSELAKLGRQLHP